MKFVNRFRAMLAITVPMVAAASLYAEQATALEFANDSGLLAALKKNKALSEKDLDAIKETYPKIEIKGSLQFQYIKAANQINEMDLKRLNLTVIGKVSDKLSVILEPVYGKNISTGIKDAAYISYKSPDIGIYVGNHRVPFSPEVLQNDINLRLVERNLTSQIAPDRMMGISASKSMRENKLIAQAGIWNTGINSKAESSLINNRLADNQIYSANSVANGSRIFIQAFRVGYSSTPRENFYSRTYGYNEDENFGGETSYAAGFSFYNSGAASTTAAVNTALTAINGSKAYEADFQLRYKKLSGEFEYANRSLDWWQYTAQGTQNSVGSVQTSYSLQASYLATENLSISMRRESFTYDAGGEVLKGAYGQDKDQWTTLGFNYYSNENNTKIQFNYIWKQEVMPVGVDAPKNDTLTVQTTTYF